MNVEIGAEAAQFPEKEYINGIAFAVRLCKSVWYCRLNSILIWTMGGQVGEIGG